MTAPASDLRLVHLETSGNQAFIFGTNKLKENIGASEMTYRAGTEAVARAINRVFGLSGEAAMPEEDVSDPGKLAEWLEARQKPIEDPSGAPGVEVILATSGKALILVRSEARARELVHAWSTELAVNLPGVDGTGVFSSPFSFAPEGSDSLPLAAAVTETHQLFEAARARRRSPLARFPRLPVADACEVSGLPAERLLPRRNEPGAEPERISFSSARKRAHLGLAQDRFASLLGEAYVPRNLEDMLEVWAFDWIGVIHADGNDLGQLFRGLAQIARELRRPEEAPDRHYLITYRSFSLGLDRVARKVFANVAAEVFGEESVAFDERERKVHLLPILPIIVGGDDLTVICDGRRALPFAHRYLTAFEDRVAALPADHLVARVLREHFGGVQRLGMAAAIALTKPKFPFFSAYSLAEELTRSAKAVKKNVGRPASALDFHVTFESSVLKLDEARDRLSSGGGAYLLHGRPYVTTPIDRLESEGLLPGELEWARAHDFAAFDGAREALAKTQNSAEGESPVAPSRAAENGRRIFPASQAHRVRAALHREPKRADVIFQRLSARYRRHGFRWPEESLWVTDPVGGTRLTRFQDALETLELFHGPRTSDEPAPAGAPAPPAAEEKGS